MNNANASQDRVKHLAVAAAALLTVALLGWFRSPTAFSTDTR